MIFDFLLFKFVATVVFNVLKDLLLQAGGKVDELGAFVDVIWGVGVQGVPELPRVASAEDGHFVEGLVAELLVVVRHESFLVREFFYFSLRKIKRFQNCGNLFGVLGGAPFFWVQTPAEHLVFLRRCPGCLVCAFNAASPLFYRALTLLS